MAWLKIIPTIFKEKNDIIGTFLKSRHNSKVGIGSERVMDKPAIAIW
jgi:hypothetical protein